MFTKSMTMKKTLLALISVISFSVSFGQTNKMTEFENGLTESKEIIFADSILHHYNIVERMKF